MSVKCGLPQFVYPLNVAAAPTDATTQFPIVVSKGTYLISLLASIVCSAAPAGVLVSLQTTNAAPPGAVNTIIFRNTAVAVAASSVLPSGALATTQVVNLQTVYTFPADTICYLNIGSNGAVGVDTYTLASSNNVNTISFTQLSS